MFCTWFYKMNWLECMTEAWRPLLHPSEKCHAQCREIIRQRRLCVCTLLLSRFRSNPIVRQVDIDNLDFISQSLSCLPNYWPSAAFIHYYSLLMSTVYTTIHIPVAVRISTFIGTTVTFDPDLIYIYLLIKSSIKLIFVFMCHQRKVQRFAQIL